MKLLFDQNLSYRLCRELADVFPRFEQLVRASLERASDATVWEYAARHGFTIVTLDGDFAEMAVLRGHPPKVIWLRCGNQPVGFIANLLRQRFSTIGSFLADPEAACLEHY